MRKRISMVLPLAIGLIFGPFVGCAASDWGYDESQPREAEVKPLRAQALSITGATAGARPGAGAAPRAVPAAAAAKKAVGAQPRSGKAGAPVTAGGTRSSGVADQEALVQECWAQIYQLAGGNKLDDAQRHDLDAVVDKQLHGTPAQRQEAQSVLAFWPKLSGYLVAHADQKEYYGVLLRALLRWQARMSELAAGESQPDELSSQRNTVTSEILGPLRLSVPGAVPFSEEAVNAYADMACFLYEQQHPGKSVDALDNRAVFAHVVHEKFKEAPSKKDQEAMAAFDLVWAKFKIVWQQADDAQRQTMLTALMKQGAGSALAKVHDNMLELVLNSWPSVAPKAPAVASRAGESPRK